MWLVLTPLLVLIGTYAIYRLRRGVTFQGTLDPAHGGYWWVIPRHKGKVRGLYLGIEAPAGFEFTLRPERWFDRLFKALGLATEFQVEEEGFDRLLYLQSDDATFLRNFTARSTRDQIWELLTLAKISGHEFQNLRAKGGRLWVELSLAGGKGGDEPTLAENLAAWLRTFRQGLEQTPTYQNLEQRDPSITRATLLGSIGMALAAVGVLLFLAIAIFSTTWILDRAELLKAAFVGGGLLFLSLLVVAIVIVGRSARRHLVVLELLFFGGLGAFGCVAGMLYSANADFDTAPAAVRETTVLEKELRRGSKGSRRYYLALDGWEGEPGTRRLQVSEELYESFREGDRVRLDEHAGRLGFRWVGDLRRLPPRAEAP